MTYRKIVPSTILGFCAIVLVIALVVKSNFLTILAILVPLMVLGAIAIIIAAASGQGKRIYKIAGAVAAWVVFFLVWLIVSPGTFNLAVHTGEFWVLQTFLVINLALLGMTGMTVFFVQTVTIIIIVVSLFSLIANFVKGGPELTTGVWNELMKTTVLAHIKKIEMLDKERQVEPLLTKLEKLKRKAQKGPLSQSDQKELRQVEIELEKIHPSEKQPGEQDGKQKKDRRHLFGILQLPKNKQVIDQDTKGQELRYLTGEYVHFQQLGSPGSFTVVNTKPAHQSWTTNRRVVTVGPTKYSDKIRLMAVGGKEIIVQVRIIPGRS